MANGLSQFLSGCESGGKSRNSAAIPGADIMRPGLNLVIFSYIFIRLITDSDVLCGKVLDCVPHQHAIVTIRIKKIGVIDFPAGNIVGKGRCPEVETCHAIGHALSCRVIVSGKQLPVPAGAPFPIPQEGVLMIDIKRMLKMRI